MTYDYPNRSLCPIDKDSGLSDTVAYYAQKLWLVEASIKDNSIFGSM